MLRQVNPSSDNDRSGGGGGLEEENGVLRHPPSHQPQDQHPNQDLQEHLNQEPHNLHIPEERISQLQSNHDLHQHDLASSSPHLHQQSQPHLESVFRGSDLVDWLIERGLCAGRAEAQSYGVRLQQGGVLDHLTSQYSFRDVPTLLYHFTQGSKT